MKLKVRPEDFIVEELTTIPVMHRGPYTLVRLTKRYWNTLDAIDYIARHTSIPCQRFARAGLKDRYALSTQYLTIKGPWRKAFRAKNIQITPVGYTDQPMSAQFMRGNRFSITLRDCSTKELYCIENNASQVRAHGFVNYFDEQRFGSARHKKGFFARSLMRKHYEGALKLLLCYPYKEDGKQERQFKRYCNEHWGHWRECLPRTPSRYRKVITTLVQYPAQFKRAIKTIDREFLNLYLLAYQSYLFNETVGKYLEMQNIDTIRVRYNMGVFVFLKNQLPVRFKTHETIPLVNDKTTLRGDIKTVVDSILEREGIRLKDFSLRKMRFRGVRFKSFLRPLIIYPKQFTIERPQDDELYPSRKKVTLKFDLPPGAYATLVIKRLMADQQ
jgi:tRNA pseudouridine13 synthase